MTKVMVSGLVVVMVLVALSISTVICRAEEQVIISGTVLSGGRLEGDDGMTYLIAVKNLGNELRMRQNRRVEVKGTVLNNAGDRPTIDVTEYKVK